MIATTELEELKTQNLPVLVERYTTLRRVSGREFAGPCPRAGCDADTDGFHVGRYDNGAWWWFCRKCHERRGDAVEFARWLLGHDFATAVEWVRGGVAVVQPSTPRTPAQPVATARAWDVHQVEREIDAGARALGGDGELGRVARAYLVKRGITLATADKFFVGAHEAWDRELRRARPALALPWAVADVVEAVKYRFVEVPTGGMRFTARAGSTFTGVFGRNAYGGRYDVLVVAEGELNAMSVHQAARAAGWPWIDAVSIGGEGGALSATTVALVADLATDFRRVLMWLDDAAHAVALRDAVRGARALRSHNDGVKWDANELLQRGMLVAFLSQVMGRLWPNATAEPPCARGTPMQSTERDSDA